jgi:biopolymer transport protein ExbD
MAKIKTKKSAASIDMTAMCDVAFLLLTFFILTATAKQQEPLPVQTPASTVQTKLPESGLVTLTLGSYEGKPKVFIGMKDRDIRKKTIELIDDRFKLGITEQEQLQFELMDEFGVPMSNLKQIIGMKSSDRNKVGFQTGIPFDSIDNQLKEWIYTARQANVELGKDKELDFAIKGDAKQQYPEIKRIMDILQDQKINSFNLVTGLRGKDY